MPLPNVILIHRGGIFSGPPFTPEDMESPNPPQLLPSTMGLADHDDHGWVISFGPKRN